MKHLYTWGGILVVVFFSVVGDILIARAMKQVGDVHELWERSGLWTVAGRVLSNLTFFLGVTAMAAAFFSLLFSLSWGDVSLVAPARRLADLHRKRLRRQNVSSRKSGPPPLDCRRSSLGRSRAAGRVRFPTELPQRDVPGGFQK